MLDQRQAFADYLKRRVPTPNTRDMQRLSVALYRLLGRGAAVTASELADSCGLPWDRVERFLGESSLSSVEFDERVAVSAYAGLSLAPTRHRLLLGNVTLYTWCAFDALFLPEILRKPAVLITRCPASDAEVTVALAPGEVRAAKPAACVLSIVAPDAEACSGNLRAAFCDHVNLFRDEATFRAAMAGRAETASVPLDEAQAFARQRNALRYPDIDLAE